MRGPPQQLQPEPEASRAGAARAPYIQALERAAAAAAAKPRPRRPLLSACTAPRPLTPPSPPSRGGAGSRGKDLERDEEAGGGSGSLRGVRERPGCCSHRNLSTRTQKNQSDSQDSMGPLGRMVSEPTWRSGAIVCPVFSKLVELSNPKCCKRQTSRVSRKKTRRA